jgi:hypothetical protein
LTARSSVHLLVEARLARAIVGAHHTAVVIDNAGKVKAHCFFLDSDSRLCSSLRHVH